MISIKKIKREDKIAFILSLRANRENLKEGEFYQYLINEYKKMSDSELNIEFKFYSKGLINTRV
jgi:hypothetical protein